MSKNNVKPNKNRKDTPQKNGAAAAITPAVMISQMLDDQFGGRKLNKRGKSSIQAIQKQVDELEKILQSNK
jgi:hypothetical protein